MGNNIRSWRDHLLIAQELMKTGKDLEALPHLQKCLLSMQLDPQVHSNANAKLLVLRTMCDIHMNREDYSTAIQLCEQGVHVFRMHPAVDLEHVVVLLNNQSFIYKKQVDFPCMTCFEAVVDDG